MLVSVNGVRLFFDVANPKLEIVEDGLREKPVLLCLHGGPGGDHQSLRPAFDRFERLAQVIYLDQRGGGRSDHGDPSDWTLDQWGDDVAAFCDVLGIDKPIVLGVSGGAMAAQAYLARHPRHARGAVLLNGCARLDVATMVAGWEALGGPEAAAAAQAMYSRGATEDLPAFVKHCLPHYSHSRNPAAFSFGAGRTSMNFAVGQHFFGPGGEAVRFDHRDRLGAVACPVLVIAGAHDPVTRPEWGEEVARALPNGEFALFEDSSHLVVADEPERFYQVVEAFIARL